MFPQHYILPHLLGRAKIFRTALVERRQEEFTIEKKKEDGVKYNSTHPITIKTIHGQIPYCPEVNPVERFWKEVKKSLKNQVFDSLDFLHRILRNILARFTQGDIVSIRGYDFILEALSIAIAELYEVGIICCCNVPLKCDQSVAICKISCKVYHAACAFNFQLADQV